MSKLFQFISDFRREKQIRLFFDIETLQYNNAKGKDMPSLYCNVVFSVAVSWWRDNELEIANFSNFYDFFEEIKAGLRKNNGEVYKKTPKIILVAHNGNKYDFHYLYTDLLYYYPEIKVRNAYLRNALFENELVESTKKKTGDYVFLKTIKAKSSLELVILLDGIKFETEDTYLKTGLPLRTIGEKLLNIGKISKDELKTDFNYTKFNRNDYLTDFKAHQYAKECFEKLDASEKIYIRNDVIILAKLVKYYSQLFIGFDYSKMTFSSNVLEYYADNPVSIMQLKNKYQKMHVKYTNYQFAGQNLYDYMKSFYFGGLNFYNDKYLGKIINERCFNVDLNSSYPNSMYYGKIPGKLEEFQSAENEFKLTIDLDEKYYYLMQISKFEFDKLLSKLDSVILRQMFVKYYSRAKQKRVSINSNTLRALEKVGHLKLGEIKIYNYLKFSTFDFGSKEKISNRYFVKTQGKNKNKIIMKNPREIEITNEKNTNVFSPEEIAQAKVVLNGLYGLPALRAYFHLFLIDENGDYESYPNGYENTERNLLFSLYVTSQSFLNFISPLQYLSAKEIDDNFLYCDTDSLYFKYRVREKIPDAMLDQFKLGYWKVEHDNISKFYVLNHKKYCYYNKKDEKIEFRCGGVSADAFNINMSFEKFISTQFSAGVELPNTKAILNQQGNISIYESTTKLQLGSKYSLFIEDDIRDNFIEKMITEIKADDDLNNEDILYIESSFITLSLSEIWNEPKKIDDCLSIHEFKNINNFIWRQLLI